MKVKRTKKGFTLIELISVVAIILILALLALPSLNGYKKKAQVSKTVATSKIILNAVETYNVEKNVDIPENEKIATLLESNKLENYIKNTEMKKAKECYDTYVTVEALRDFVNSKGETVKTTGGIVGINVNNEVVLSPENPNK